MRLPQWILGYGSGTIGEKENKSAELQKHSARLIFR